LVLVASEERIFNFWDLSFRGEDFHISIIGTFRFRGEDFQLLGFVG
jgi:hypothetical protein